MVATHFAHRNRHIVNDSLGEVIRSQEEVCAMLGFAQNIGHTVGLYKFPMIVGVMVNVFSGVRCRHHGEYRKGEGLRLRFLQVVATVVPTALQGPFFWCIAIDIGSSVRHHRACAVFHMARAVEPGLGVTATLDSEELECGILCHCVNVVTHNKRARNFVADLDAQARIGGHALRNFTDKDVAGRSGKFDLVTQCVGSRNVCAGDNRPVALGCGFGCSERSGHLGLERLAVNIHDFKFRGLAPHKVEPAFRIALEVARLVHANRRNLRVDGVKVGLVQGVGHHGARLKVCRRLVDVQDTNPLGDRGVELFKYLRVPAQWPGRANQVIWRCCGKCCGCRKCSQGKNDFF